MLSQCKIAEQVIEIKVAEGMEGPLVIQPKSQDPNQASKAADNKKKFIRRTNTTGGEVNYEVLDSNPKFLRASGGGNPDAFNQRQFNSTEMSSIDMELMSRDRTDSNLTKFDNEMVPGGLEMMNFAKIRNSDPIKSTIYPSERHELTSPMKKPGGEASKYKFGVTEGMQELKRQSTPGNHSPGRSLNMARQEMIEDLMHGITGASDNGSPQPTVHKGMLESDQNSKPRHTASATNKEWKHQTNKQPPTIVVERTTEYSAHRDVSPSVEEGSLGNSEFGELVKFRPFVRDAKCMLKTEAGARNPPKGSEIVAFTMPKTRRVVQPVASKNYFVGPTNHSFTGLRTKEISSMSSGYIHSSSHRNTKEGSQRESVYAPDLQLSLMGRRFSKQRGSSPELHPTNRDQDTGKTSSKMMHKGVDRATQELEAFEESELMDRVERGRDQRRISILSANTNPGLKKGPTQSLTTVKAAFKSSSFIKQIGTAWDSHGRFASEEIKGLNQFSTRSTRLHQASCQGSLQQKDKTSPETKKPFFCDCDKSFANSNNPKPRYLVLSPKTSQSKNVIENFRYPVSHRCNIDESSVHHPDYFGLLKF